MNASHFRGDSRTMSGQYWESLSQRRRALRMGFSALSERTGVSIPTLKRIINGQSENPTLHSLQSIATALGVEIQINGRIEVIEQSSAHEFREKAAEEKAEKIVGLVQGTSALEAQAVGPTDLRTMVKQTVHDLMSGPARRLWSS